MTKTQIVRALREAANEFKVLSARVRRAEIRAKRLRRESRDLAEAAHALLTDPCIADCVESAKLGVLTEKEIPEYREDCERLAGHAQALEDAIAAAKGGEE